MFDLRAVLAAYPPDLQPRWIDDQAAVGGFSGARIWRLVTPAGMLCLKEWPAEHPTAERLTHIHAVLRHVWAGGLRIVPLPLATADGRTFVEHRGCLWELTPWMPGEADYHRDRRPEKLAAALNALAQFHTASASLPGLPDTPAGAPGIVERLELLRRLQETDYVRIAAVVRSWPNNPLAAHARRLIDLFPRLASPLKSRLESAARLSVRRVPCLRDIWHDHVLFTGDAVTGLIDFGALRTESPAADVARLLGSLVGDDADGWQAGLDAYRQVRPLTENELRLVEAFDRANVLLAGLNWLRWLCLEGRQFARMDQVVERLGAIVARLERVGRSSVRP